MKSYFKFSRKEKIGVLTLSALILILTVVLNVGYATYVPNSMDIDESKLSFISVDKNENNFINEEALESTTNGLQQQVIHNFDPNEIGINDWMELGFSRKQAESIISYRERFGPFNRKEDLKKIYVISDKKYSELEPYMVFTSKTSNDNDDTNVVEDAQIEPIELNTATVADLIKLKGIGEGYGNRIVNYRDKIGGFVDFEQIDALSISEEAKSILKEKGIINASIVEKVNINLATKDELKAIPYSNWILVTSILKQRDINPLTNLDFITDKEISAENKIKFELYITF